MNRKPTLTIINDPTPLQRGKDDYARNAAFGSCPYPMRNTKARNEWRNGWLAAQEMAHESGEKQDDGE